MSQGQQPQRPKKDEISEQDPIKYGDVFNVSSELGKIPIKPQDAATMQAAENLATGQTQRGGPAAVMQSAAAHNQKAGLVEKDDVSEVAREKGITISESNAGGQRVVTEALGGEVLGQYTAPTLPMESPGTVLNRDAITIGEALEATALSSGDKPIDKIDAAAIHAAEMRATGKNETQPGGIAAEAMSAVARNERTMHEESKTKLSDVLSNATQKLVSDKPVTCLDAEGVIGAELRNNPNMSTTPGGVAESLAAAA